MNRDDAIIRSLYMAAAGGDWEGFRSEVLARVGEYLGAAAAAWITQGQGAGYGEFAAWPQNIATGAKAMLGLNLGNGHDRPPPLAGYGEGVLLRYEHQDGGLTSTLALWPRESGKLAVDDKARRVVEHMVESSAVALAVYVQRDEWLLALGRPNRGSTALVDASGAVYAASPSFRRQIGEAYGSAQFTRLPVHLPQEALDTDGLFSDSGLRFRARRAGNLYVIHTRKALPLDGLSPREQEIARALGHGKTFKSVAREKGIAVSTVANHASRIYRKLGIYRREDLMEIVRRPRQQARH